MLKSIFIKRWQGKFLVVNILIILASSLLVEFSYRQSWFSSSENIFFDSCQRYSGISPDYSPDVVIVAIDQKTLTAYNDLPMVFWGPYFSQALARLHQSEVLAIGLDLIFTISPEDCLQRLGAQSTDLIRAYDVDFRSQLHNRKTVLAGKAIFSDKESRVVLPVADYLYSLSDTSAGVGLANLVQDNDGVIRSYIPRLFDEKRAPSLSFAALLISKAGFSLPVNGLHRINYIGPPGTFPRISFLDLVKASPAELEQLQTQLRGKIVIISVEDTGFNDYHLTPYATGISFSKKLHLMSGAEVHANIIETMLSHKQFRNLDKFTRFIWLLAAVTLGVALFHCLTPGRGFLALLLLIFISALISFKLFFLLIIAPVTSVAVALSCSYLGILGLRLTAEEREHRYLIKVFTPYLSESILEDLLSRQELPFLGGEEREITALFSDIRNFTTISEKLAPEEVVEMLNYYYGLICDEIISCGGLIDKFVGDAVMVVFGAPMPTSEHADNALKAGLAIVATAGKFQEWLAHRFPEHNLPHFTVGVGINTGKALIGNVGSEQRMGYTAIGDTVNIASRLESASKDLGWSIVASEATVKACSREVTVGRCERIKPKGRSGTIEVFEVLTCSQGDMR